MRGKNEVIDLRSYRSGEAEDAHGTDAGPQNLTAGTALLLGQYTITGYLNCGGFGITYLARDSLERTVVVKECFPSDLAFRSGKKMAARSPKFREELTSIIRHFVNEAHRLANARHPNVVHVHQIFEENDTAYIAMDFIDGPDLLDIVTQTPKRFSPREVVTLTRKMLEAIRYVHERGMLHRDISPDNILIGPDGEPVLIDFGAAREHAQKSNRAHSKLKFVKDGYSPQEFYIAGAPQGTWSDLYSFAATMYHVITGVPPVDGQTRLGALAAKKPDPYVPLTGTVTGYPARFLKALDKALEILPEKRLQTAEDWLEMISNRVPASEAKRRPIAAVADRFAGMPASGSLLRVAAEKRAFAVGVITAGLALGVLAVQPWSYFGGQPGAEAAVPSASLAPERSAAVLPKEPSGPDSRPNPAAARPGTAGETAPVALTRLPSFPFPGTAADATPALPATGVRPVVLAPAALAPAPLPAPVPRAAEGAEPPPLPATSADAGAPVAVTGVMRLALPAVLESPATPETAHLARPEPIPAVSKPLLRIAGGQPPVPAAESVPAPGQSAAPPRAGLRQAALPAVEADRPAASDIAAPPPEPAENVAARQVVYSHWDARMPFEGEPERVRNANTVRIAAVDPVADLDVSGSWIAEDVVIYAFNGERLPEDMPLSAQILNSLVIDPDGYARATVRYREPASDTISLGLLAVPVVRVTGLADGTVLQTGMENLVWVTRVREAAPGTLLREGDILVAEERTGTAFAGHEDISRALDALARARTETAEFTVLRAGSRQTVSWRLAPG
jgi:tRNA A-37 threonylcarbamoyl transferase component Bud32